MKPVMKLKQGWPLLPLPERMFCVAGGDEFVAIIPGDGQSDSCTALRSTPWCGIGKPYQLAGLNIQSMCSVGGARMGRWLAMGRTIRCYRWSDVSLQAPRTFPESKIVWGRKQSVDPDDGGRVHPRNEIIAGVIFATAYCVLGLLTLV